MAIGLTPYFNFAGNTREAMEFYASVLGGELEILTFAEGMGDTNPDSRDGVMHSSLFVGPGFHIMASDAMSDDSANGTVSLSTNAEDGSDSETLRGYWDGLSDGATVIEPLTQAPWGSTFGILKDKYGIVWMFNI